MKYAPQGRHEFGLFSRSAGSLRPDDDIPPFKLYFGTKSNRFSYQLYEAFYHKLTDKTPDQNALWKAHTDFKSDVWYINTIVIPEYAQLAVKNNIPYVLHVHELPQEYDFQSYDDFKFMLDHAQLLFCASETVVQNLNDMGYQNAVVMHGLINVDDIKTRENRDQLRKEIGIPEGRFVWLMSGAWSTRKGFDFIPQLLPLLPPQTYFIWMGPKRRSGYTYYVEQSIKEKGLNVIFLAEQADRYFDFFNCCDGFVLTSREDSYPIVMREAACLGKPIVGFNSGGIVEFVQPGMGEFVEGFNPRELADAMKRVMSGQTPIDVNVLKSAVTTEKMYQQGERFSQILESIKK